jgi:hypothetical protein
MPANPLILTIWQNEKIAAPSFFGLAMTRHVKFIRHCEARSNEAILIRYVNMNRDLNQTL